jgi:DNA-binding winged helix-turn-helix (wHTH) protein/tetratricopeptide (TPR) repeat protein
MLTFGHFELDERLFELRAAGKHVPVQPKTLDLLVHLVRHRERVVMKADLLEALWPDVDVGDTTLMQAIMTARKALGDDGGGQRFIATVRGRGYRFVAHVEERADPPVPPSGQSRAALSIGSGSRQPFVGREAAMGLLSRRLDEALGGTGRVVVALGEPGIGKSRLAEEFEQVARARGAAALTGRCRADDGAPGYWPWVQIVRSYVVDVGEAAALDALGPFASDVAALVPYVAELAKLPPCSHSSTGADGRFRAFDGFVRFLVRASTQRPLLLVVEDLHWADVDSLALLRFVARELRAARVLLLVTCRGSALARDDTPTAASLGELLREDPARRLALDGLAEPAIAAFIEAATGERASAELVAKLDRKTAGNPLYLDQLLHGGDVEARLAALASGLSPGGPADGLRDCVERHLTALSPDCRRMLSMAAVLGAEPRLSTLCAALRATQEQLLELVDEAVLGRMIERTTPGTLRFTHEIVCDVLGHELRSAERARLHAAAAEALSTEYAARPEPHLDELAQHFRLAAPVLGSRRAVDHLVRAARYAARTAAVDRAVKSFELALETLADAGGDDATRFDLLLGLGDALRKTEDHARARHLLREAADLAREFGDGKRLAEAALAYASEPESGSIDGDRVAMLESALAFCPPCPAALRAMLLARLGEALYFSDDHARYDALAREAVELAREVGEPVPLLVALHSLHCSRLGAKEQIALSEEMLRVADALGDPEYLAIALTARMHDLFELAELDELDQTIARFNRLTEELRLPFYRFQATVFRTARALLAGRLDAAEASFNEALAFGRPEPLAHLWLNTQLFVLRREQGRLREIEPVVRALSEQFPELAPWRCGLATIACEMDHLDEARAILEHFVDTKALRRLRDDSNRPMSLAALAGVCAAVEDRPRAGVLYEALLPLDGAAITVGHGVAWYAPASQCLGMLAAVRGELDRAVAHLEQAVATTARMDAKALLMSAQMELGRALVKRGKPGDKKRASGLLGEATKGA